MGSETGDGSIESGGATTSEGSITIGRYRWGSHGSTVTFHHQRSTHHHHHTSSSTASPMSPTTGSPEGNTFFQFPQTLTQVHIKDW